MTHQEFRAEYPADPSLEPSACPGELVRLPNPTEDRRCVVTGHIQEFHECRECGNTVVLDLTVRRVTNDYPDVRRMVLTIGERSRIPR